MKELVAKEDWCDPKLPTEIPLVKKGEQYAYKKMKNDLVYVATLLGGSIRTWRWVPKTVFEVGNAV